MNTVQLLTSNTNCNTATICSLNVTMTVMSYCSLLRLLYSTVLPAKPDVISFSYTDAQFYTTNISAWFCCWVIKGLKKSFYLIKKGLNSLHVHMCHSWAFAKLAHRSAELEKQQVWTPLGLSDKFTHTCADTHTRAHHLDSISACWRAYNHHPFLSVAPHSLSKDPEAKPGGCCKEIKKKKKKKLHPLPTSHKNAY